MTAASSLPAPTIATPLRFQRLFDERPPAHGHLLGVRRLVSATGGPAGAQGETLAAELLAPRAVAADAWLTDSPVTELRYGAIRLCVGERWLHGSACIGPERMEAGLEQTAYRIYAQIFELLSLHAAPHLLRVWNYIPRINNTSGGIERYLQFNSGRQRAFIDAGRSAFEGAPAACALGVPHGALQVFFLAGPRCPLAIENPRQVSAYHYPSDYGPRSPTFSRAAFADVGGGQRALFISGTASIRGHATVHEGDVRRQTEETLDNIDAILGAAAAHGAADLSVSGLTCTVYLRRRGDLEAVQDIIGRRLGGHSHAARTAVYLLADICRADLLVEIEAHAYVAAGDPA